MERITMSIDEDLAAAFDELIAARGYASRSEAMRDLLRREVEAHRVRYRPHGRCVASLSYVYNHHVRDLAERLTATQHEHHDLVVATTHLHLDHEHCLENAFLKGSKAAVQGFAERVLAERGVSHGQLNLIAVEGGDRHALSGAHRHAGHMHLTPQLAVHTGTHATPPSAVGSSASAGVSAPSAAGAANLPSPAGPGKSSES